MCRRLAWDALSVARGCAKLGGVGPILPTSAPLAILPTHDRLYTIIGSLNYCLSAADDCGPQTTGAKPILSCREDMRG